MVNSSWKLPVAMAMVCLLLSVPPINAARVETVATHDTAVHSSWGAQSCDRMADTFEQQMGRMPVEPVDTARVQLRVMYRMWSITRTLRRAQAAECDWVNSIDPESMAPLQNLLNQHMESPCAPQAQEMLANVEELPDEERIAVFTRAMRVLASEDCTIPEDPTDVEQQTAEEAEMDVEEGDEILDQLTEESLMQDTSLLEMSAAQMGLTAVILMSVTLIFVVAVACYAIQWILYLIISLLLCGFRALAGYGDTRECMDTAIMRFQSSIAQVLRGVVCAVPVGYASVGAFMASVMGLAR